MPLGFIARYCRREARDPQSNTNPALLIAGLAYRDFVMKFLPALLALLLPIPALATSLPLIQRVFIILMENCDWSGVKGSANAPYINKVLLPMASYGEQYYNPPHVHPSEPLYLWLEAGTNFGITDDNDPSDNHQNTTHHLVTLLQKAGISWKTYQEDISGTYVPLWATNGYAPKHNAFVYFDDVTGTNNPAWAYGVAHIRPYGELAADLTNNTVARYSFITPNLCHDGHDSCSPVNNPVKQVDNWLAAQVPRILNSAAWQDGGALFITWDEGASGGDGPLGMIVISPLGHGGGYFNNIYYTHSSTLRTFQEIFGVTPLLGDAANATDLSDLFSRFEVGSVVRLPGGGLRVTAAGVIPGRTNLVQTSSDLITWTSISTNAVGTNTFTVTDGLATDSSPRFYRLVQLP
jgi:phosphatidylinositol-3-phosphatase